MASCPPSEECLVLHVHCAQQMSLRRTFQTNLQCCNENVKNCQEVHAKTLCEWNWVAQGSAQGIRVCLLLLHHRQPTSWALSHNCDSEPLLLPLSSSRHVLGWDIFIHLIHFQWCELVTHGLPSKPPTMDWSSMSQATWKAQWSQCVVGDGRSFRSRCENCQRSPRGTARQALPHGLKRRQTSSNILWPIFFSYVFIVQANVQWQKSKSLRPPLWRKAWKDGAVSMTPGDATNKGFTRVTAPVISFFLISLNLKSFMYCTSTKCLQKVQQDLLRSRCLSTPLRQTSMLVAMSWKSGTLPLHCWDFHLSNSEDSEVQSIRWWTCIKNLSPKPKCSCSRVLEASTWPTVPTVRVEMPQNVTEHGRMAYQAATSSCKNSLMSSQIDSWVNYILNVL